MVLSKRVTATVRRNVGSEISASETDEQILISVTAIRFTFIF